MAEGGNTNQRGGGGRARVWWQKGQESTKGDRGKGVGTPAGRGKGKEGEAGRQITQQQMCENAQCVEKAHTTQTNHKCTRAWHVKGKGRRVGQRHTCKGRVRKAR